MAFEFCEKEMRDCVFPWATRMGRVKCQTSKGDCHCKDEWIQQHLIIFLSFIWWHKAMPIAQG